VRQETLASEQLLELVANSPSFQGNAGVNPLSRELQLLFNNNHILCLQWRDDVSTDLQTFGTCPQGLSLEVLLTEAGQGHARTSYSGMAWNGFFCSRRFLQMAIPADDGQNSSRTIGLIRSLENVSTPILQVQKILIAYLVINVLFFATIGFIRLVHLVISPIQRLAQLADSRADQSDSDFFTGERWGEFTQLSLSLNRLVSRIDGDKQELETMVKSLKKANDELQRNRDEMIRAEKLASIGRLSAGLAHEIGNPLSIVQGYIDLLGDDSLSSEDRKNFSQRAVQELSRINNLIRGLLDLSRTPAASTVAPVNIHQLLRDIVDAVRIRKNAVEIRYSTNLQAEEATVIGDSDGLRQVFLNCILNGIDAIEEKPGDNPGKIRLTTDNTFSESGDRWIRIELHDNGAGLDKEHLETIFDPFFTTKEVGKGTGLGLAVAHNMIKRSGGTIHFSSTAGEGSRVIISLPLAHRPESNTEEESSHE
ncbi:MAG: ATP-binding protein, partial [Thermodesulfobacteriota bacterium]